MLLDPTEGHPAADEASDDSCRRSPRLYTDEMDIRHYMLGYPRTQGELESHLFGPSNEERYEPGPWPQPWSPE